MKSLLAVVAAIFFISAVPAMAQAPSSCAQLLAAYDTQDRQIAMTDATGIGDDSAPRATTRELRILNRQIQKLGLIEIMRGRNCPLPNDTNGHLSYGENARNCNLAIARADISGRSSSAPSIPSECDQSKWIRGGGYIPVSKPAPPPLANVLSNRPTSPPQIGSAPQSGPAQISAPPGSLKLTPGLVVTPLTDFVAKAANVPGTTGGLVVLEVQDGSAAQKAGAVRGDIIISANGYYWSSQATMTKAINDFGPGYTLRLKVWRDGTERDLLVRQPSAN